MAPIDPLTTNRYKVSYTGPFGTHTMLFHGINSSTQSELRDSVAEVINDMSGMTWNGTTFNKAEYALDGSPLFFDDPDWTTITRTSATNPTATDAPSHFVQFGGRTLIGGVRVKLYLFETTLRDNEDMRYSVADDADVALIVDDLNDPSTSIAAINGNRATWYGYANVGQNDYLTHKARR